MAVDISQAFIGFNFYVTFYHIGWLQIELPLIMSSLPGHDFYEISVFEKACLKIQVNVSVDL